MPDYIFKTYIDSGREYYEYTDAADREQTIKKDFPFPESLMDLLYMDTQELEAITKKMDKALLAFYQSGAKDDLQVVAAGLDELASRHVYFELLRLDWTERLKAAERVTPKEYLRLLPHKKISHIYSNIDTMQRQIISLIAHALDMDGEKIDLRKIDIPIYVYGSREDHIVPIGGAYASTQVFPGKKRFVMGASGHIAGVINPPAAKKRSHWVRDDGKFPKTADEWIAGAEEVAGSWWTDWADWLKSHAGKQVAAPKDYGKGTQYKAIEPAPGRYVKAKA